MPIKFAGFDTKQINDILAMAGRTGPPLAADEAQNLLNADKRYNAFYNRQVEKAMALVEGTGMATGGFVFPSTNARGKINAIRSKDNPEYAESAVEQQSSAVNQMQQTFAQPEDQMRPLRGFARGGQLLDAQRRVSLPDEYFTNSGPQQVTRTDGGGPSFSQITDMRDRSFDRPGITAPITDTATLERINNPRITRDVLPERDMSRPSRFPRRGEEGNFYGDQPRPGLTQMPEPRRPFPPIFDPFRPEKIKTRDQIEIEEARKKAGVEGPGIASVPPEPDPALTFLNAAQQAYSDSLAAQQEARDALAADPSDESLKTALEAADSSVVQSKEARTQATAQYKETATDSAPELLNKALTDPDSMTTTADTATISEDQAKAGEMAGTEGAGAADTATGTTADTAADVVTQPTTDASVVDTTGTTSATEELMKEVDAATGEVSDDATVVAAEKDPTTSEALDIEAAQITDPTKVAETEDRKLKDDELIAGSTVDMDKVKKETNFEAATGSPSTDATVQGQLTSLMEDFEGGDPPPWAAGAMRAASAAMAARGLGASSMAGQAIIQAAMESALPIAQIDAATFSRFEEQNLSNRQQAAMFAAEKRAQFLGIEFDQEFQTRVANAAKVSDIANMNFTADQQVAIENARLAQTADLANLDAKNAKVMADSATIAQLELANLDNRQKAQVENAKSFLQMDLANLDNEQQAELFKTQTIANSILSDAAAENAAAQFNASSENQTKQFFASMANQVAQFNNEQTNAMNRFNAGETNALAEFNTTQKNLRGQFNAQNSLIIEQANAEWYQKIATTDNAATNQANRDAAAAANNMTTLGFGAYMQEVRDLMSYSWQTANNDADRATNLAIAKVAGDANMANAKAKKYSGLWTALGAVVGGL